MSGLLVCSPLLRKAKPNEIKQIFAKFRGWTRRGMRPNLIAMRRAGTTVLAIVDPKAAVLRVAATDPSALVGKTNRVQLMLVDADSTVSMVIEPHFLLGRLVCVLAWLLVIAQWLRANESDLIVREARGRYYFDLLDLLSRNSVLLDASARAVTQARHDPTSGSAVPKLPPPFDRPEALSLFVPAEPMRRSVVLLHNSYYYFNCLAKALKRRGWDAVTVSVEAPDSPQRQFYDGEDINLHDPDADVMRERIRDFFRLVPERFGALHFYGMGQASFFPDLFENKSDPSLIPWDFLELRRHRIVIGNMPSGCMEGARQSSIRRLSGGVCSHCIWETRPDVCNEDKSMAWMRKLNAVCDWVGLECDFAVNERIGPKTVYGPVITNLDPRRWHPEIEVPDDMRIEREPGEVLVFHAVGNYATRRAEGRDIKGTGAFFDAIERLKADGLSIKLIFAQNVPSNKMRFLQVQSDIVVEQLNYGRYGATAPRVLDARQTCDRAAQCNARPAASALTADFRSADRPCRRKFSLRSAQRPCAGCKPPRRGGTCVPRICPRLARGRCLCGAL